MPLCLYHLSSPIDDFSNPIVKEFYLKAVECKINGFSSVYGDVNPIDSTEIICDHFMFCLPTEKGLEVVSTFKVLKNSQAKRFKMTPPCFSLINTIECEIVRRQLTNSLENYYDKKESCYMYAWTINKELRRSPLATEIRRLTLSVLRHYTVDESCGATIVGMKKVKTDSMLQDIGFEPFLDTDGEKIGHFNSPLYDNSEALLLNLNTWDSKFVSESNKDKEFYDNRIKIGNNKKNSLKVAA